jgi:hypothetical protein
VELVLTDDYSAFEYLLSEQSPENFLICLEDALESGELTIDEVAQLIHDYNHRC